jgi:tetratricopeptide (TPR) repeat protein
MGPRDAPLSREPMRVGLIPYLEALATRPRTEVPLGVPALEWIAEMAEQRGDGDVRQLMLEYLTRAAEPAIRARAHERLGDLRIGLEEWSGAAASWMDAAALHESAHDVNSAQRLYRRALDALARGDEAESAIAHAARRRLVELSLEIADPDEAAAALEEMLMHGALVWDVVDLFERVAVHPGQATAVDRLILHYECAGRLEDAARIARRALRYARSAAERSRLLEKLLRFRTLATAMDQLGVELAGADDLLVRIYRAVLVRALAAWRRAPTDTAFEEAAEVAWEAIDRLKTIYLRQGDAAAAARLLERGGRLRFSRSRQRVLIHAAALLADDATAIRLFTEVFEEDADDGIARASLRRFTTLLESGGHDARLALLLERRGKAAGHGGRARAFFERAGALWERAVVPTRACEAYAAGAAIGSERSLEALARIHRARGEWDRAASALQALLASSSAARRPSRLLRLAEAYLALDRPDLAEPAIDELLRSRPDDEAASAARAMRIEVLRRTGDARALAEMLEAEAPLHRPARAAAFLLEAGELYRTTLGDAHEAVRLLERAKLMDNTNAAIYPKLASALETLAMWDALIELLAEHVAALGHGRGAECVAIRLRVSDALLRRGRTADALDQLRTAAKLAPTEPGVLSRRAKLELESGDLDAAERTYRAALLLTGSVGGTARVEIYVALSSIAIRRRDDSRAESLLESALDRLLPALEDPSATAVDATERAQLLAAVARVWREHGGFELALGRRIREGVGRLQRILAENAPAPDAGWEALCFVCTALGDEAMLHEVARARADTAATSPGCVVEIDTQTLEVARAPAPDLAVWDSGFDADLLVMRELADDELDEAVARDPSNSSALSRLAALAVAGHDWARAADLYERLMEVLDLPEDDPARRGLVIAFGEACERAGRPADAREALERAFALDPAEIGVALQLERTCEAMGERRRLSELLIARAERTRNAVHRARLLLDAARLVEEQPDASERPRRSDIVLAASSRVSTCHLPPERQLRRLRA